MGLSEEDRGGYHPVAQLLARAKLNAELGAIAKYDGLPGPVITNDAEFYVQQQFPLGLSTIAHLRRQLRHRNLGLGKRNAAMVRGFRAEVCVTWLVTLTTARIFDFEEPDLHVALGDDMVGIEVTHVTIASENERAGSELLSSKILRAIREKSAKQYSHPNTVLAIDITNAVNGAMAAGGEFDLSTLRASIESQADKRSASRSFGAVLLVLQTIRRTQTRKEPSLSNGYTLAVRGPDVVLKHYASGVQLTQSTMLIPIMLRPAPGVFEIITQLLDGSLTAKRGATTVPKWNL